MSSQRQTSVLSGASQSYEKLCCLFLGWDDACNERSEGIKGLESVLHNKYGAFCHSTSIDHTDVKWSEQAFLYVVEDFVKENNSQKNLLLIVYSGSSYVHEGQLFLEPHQHTEPTVQWTDYLDRRILLAVARVLLIFDTTDLRPHHYTQMWKETCNRVDTMRFIKKQNVPSILATNGSDTNAVTSSLTSASLKNPGGITISELYDAMCRREATAVPNHAELYEPRFHGFADYELVLLPLPRPRLGLYEHHAFKDPHDEYLSNYITIHRDGCCHVMKVTLGPELQQFSVSACVVAVKRFTVSPRSRAYIREDFLREKEHLVEVSKWEHRHLLGMLATFETRCSGFETLNIVLPFARGGNLYDFLRLERNTRWERRGFPSSDPSLIGSLGDWRYAVYRETVGLAEAVTALHADDTGKFIIHCDIKPANVLIDGGVFKLADFGLSRFKDSDETSKTEWYRGTALYSPPERESLMGRGRDVWALGCVFLEVALMIRYAFQTAVFGKPGEPQDPEYAGLRNIIDLFEVERRNSNSITGERTAIYYKTMERVRQEIESFSGMRPGLRRRITVDGMFPVIRRMMEEDPKSRITAAEAAAQLKANYLSLQHDPQLQEEIIETENPGGPPVVLLTDDDWKRPDEGRMCLDQRQSAIMALQAAQHDIGPHQVPIYRTATAPAGSSGATDKMAGVVLHETRRTLSSENTPYYHVPGNPRPISSHDFIGTMPRPDAFGGHDNPRSSSFNEDGSNKRRRTGDDFRS